VRLQCADSGKGAHLASASTDTYCFFDSGAGIPLCYEYWLNSYGPAWYGNYGRWLWAGQVSVWLGGEYQGTRWLWCYWTGSQWIYFGYA
jgi:hypothetical protein